MPQEEAEFQVEKLNVQSVNHLGNLLRIPPEKLLSLSASPNAGYRPFDHVRAKRPFQRRPPAQPRHIDNPLEDLSWAQKQGEPAPPRADLLPSARVRRDPQPQRPR